MKVDEEKKTAGPYRQWALEQGWTHATDQPRAGLRTRASVLWDTERWGVWKMEGWRQSSENARQESVSNFSLSGHEIPIDKDWIGSVDVGSAAIWQSPSQSAMNSRFFIPSQGLVGLKASVQKNDKINAFFASGKAKDPTWAFGGLAGSGQTSGNVTTEGISFKTEQGDRIGLQAIHLKESQNNHDSAFLSWSGMRDNVSLQQNVWATKSEEGLRMGGWLDAAWGKRAKQNASLFYLERGLRWGSQAVPQNIKGASYRVSEQTRQWGWSASTEYAEAVDQTIAGALPATLYGQAFGRYWFAPNQQWTGGLMVRSGSGEGTQLQVGWDTRNPIGPIRAQVDKIWQPKGHAATRWSFSQSLVERERFKWGVAASTETSKTESNGRGGSKDVSSSFSWSASANAAIDLQVRAYRSDDEQSRSSGHSVSLGGAWNIDKNWSLQAAVTSQKGQSVFTNVTSPLAFNTSSNVRSAAWIVLRFQESSGSPTPVRGKALGDIDLVVFLDENRNGVRDETEQGVANATVVLDGRAAFQTDAAGKLFITNVLAGLHTLTLLPDRIPLPWRMETNQTHVEVGVRDVSRVTFGLIQ